ncbi:MAG: N-acetylmuramoyl-L-alanine amidase, partial [Acidimicrobiales bacterium]
MSSTRRSFLRAAALTPALAVLTRPLGRFGGDAAAMATHGVEVPSAGLVIDASGLVGVSLSWAPSAGGSSVAPVADVRARTGGTWGRWTPIEPDRGHGPDDPGREHGPPILVPGADAHEISPRPGVTGLRVHPLDGGADAAPFSALTTVSPMPGLDIIERHNWTDRPRKATWDCVLGSSLFGRGCRADVGLRHAIVHHTVNVNDYGQGAVPTLLIGIQRYHMDTRGWDDIAYNFVVDRFARIWQTREADLIEPITGGHTTGLNTESVGVAVLGDFRGHDPGAAVADVIGTLLGWK